MFGLLSFIEVEMRSVIETLLRTAVLIIIAALIASLMPACGPKPEPQESCNFTQNVYGERLSWKKNLPIPIYVHSSFPSQYLPALYEAINVWDNGMGKKAFQVMNEHMDGPLEPGEDHRSVIYWMNNWESSMMNEEQGKTTAYNIGNEIIEADIRINASHATAGSGTAGFGFYLNAPTKGRDVHLESLLIHELGHVLGLKHNDNGESVMDTHLSASTKRTSLSSSDLSSLQCEY
jgi:hypothetical protein